MDVEPSEGGHIHVALYAERAAIPRRQVFTLNVEGKDEDTLGREVLEKRISRGAIVREMSCDLRMSPETAESLANWLLEQAAAIKGEQES